MEQSQELSFKQQRMFRWMVWIFAAAMVLHNLEELLRMLPFIQERINDFPAFFRQLAAQWQPLSFTLSIWLINIGAVLLAWYIGNHLTGRKTQWLLSLLATLMIVNAFSHIGQSIYLRALAPGVVTAVLLILPITLSILVTQYRYALLNPKTHIVMFLVALPLMLLVIFLFITVSGWIVALF